MITQYDTTYTIQRLDASGAPSGASVTLCCHSDNVNQGALAIIKRVHSCCPRDANNNPIPNIRPIPDCPQIEVVGTFAAFDGTTTQYPPKWTPGTTVQVTVNGGFNYEGTGYITEFGDTGNENGDRTFRFMFVLDNLVIADRS